MVKQLAPSDLICTDKLNEKNTLNPLVNIKWAQIKLACQYAIILIHLASIGEYNLVANQIEKEIQKTLALFWLEVASRPNLHVQQKKGQLR